MKKKRESEGGRDMITYRKFLYTKKKEEKKSEIS